MRLHRILISFLLLLSGIGFTQDSKTATKEMNVVLAAPIPQVKSASIVASIPGDRTVYYWIVSIDANGNKSLPGGMFTLSNSQTTIGARYNNKIRWQPISGVVSYDVLRTDTKAVPTGECNCAVVKGITATFVEDNSETLLSYTVSKAGSNFVETNEFRGNSITARVTRYNGTEIESTDFDGNKTARCIETPNHKCVSKYAGVTAADKITNAQNACDAAYRCVIEIDPIVSLLDVGELPARCEKCIWFDFTGKYGGLLGGAATGSEPTGGTSPFEVPWSSITGIGGTKNGTNFLRDDGSWNPISWAVISGKPNFSFTNPYHRYTPGALTANQVLLDYMASTYAFVPTGCSDSNGTSQFKMGTAPTGALTFSIKKNGVEFGTIAVASGQTLGTFNCPSTNVDITEISDSFNYPNMDDAKWVQPFRADSTLDFYKPNSTDMRSRNNPSTTGTWTGSLIVRTDAPSGNNQFCRAKFAGGGGSGQAINGACGIHVTYNQSNKTWTGYALGHASSSIVVYKCVNQVNGSFTSCSQAPNGSGTTGSPVANQYYELQMFGNQLFIKNQSGATLRTYTDDAGALTGGTVGFMGAGTMTVDDFSAGIINQSGAATIQQGDEITVVAPATVTGADPTVTLYTATQISASDGNIGGGGSGGGTPAAPTTQRYSLRSCQVSRVSSADTSCVGSGTWPTAMADADYGLLCSIGDPVTKSASKLNKWSFVWLTKSNTGFTYTVTNNDGGTDGQTVALDCMAVK